MLRLFFFFSCTVAVLASVFVAPDETRVIRVPAEVSTIQEAVARARDGDTVLVAPGHYVGGIVLDKTITLASEFHVSGDRECIDKTILDGDGGEHGIYLAGVGPTTAIIGLTITNADDGIRAHSQFRLLHSRIVGNRDGVDYEPGSGGLCAHNVFENNRDDGIDLGGDVGIVIEHNVIRNNGGSWSATTDPEKGGGDGIEIRLKRFAGPTAVAVIRDNLIAGNRADGIQVVDCPAVGDYYYRIERNLILGNRKVGIGFMGNEETVEDASGYSIAEPFLIAHNVIRGNRHGVTAGGRLVLVNNIVADNRGVGIKSPAADAVVMHCLLWQNGENFVGIERGGNLVADPQLDDDQRPLPTSPVIDAGTANCSWPDGKAVVLGAGSGGGAPDIGAFEVVR